MYIHVDTLKEKRRERRIEFVCVGYIERTSVGNTESPSFFYTVVLVTVN
jgi:hypothetical protein